MKNRNSRTQVLENETHFEHSALNTSNQVYKNVSSRFVQNEPVCISLSGGVDSMVILCILKDLCECTALHINYRNREESDEEQAFLEEWCKHYNVPLKTLVMDLRREDTERGVYERVTNNMRYSFYKENMQTNCEAIVLGHHRNDIVENVIGNVMAQKSLFDIHSIPYTSVVNGVVVKRPLIDNYKKDVIEFALEHGIPYFKDTTPTWSVRGRLRNSLFKSFKEIYENYDHALYNLATECSTWGDVVQEHIIEPMYAQVYIRLYDIYIPRKIFYKMGFPIWKRFFTYLFHKNNCSMISNKSLSELYDRCNTEFMGKVHLKKGIICDVLPEHLHVSVKGIMN